MDDLLLRHIYACARTQDFIDTGVSHFVRKQMPTVGALITKRWLDRSNDGDRLALLHATAVEADYSVDLRDFDEVYLQSIELRNRLAHSGALPTTEPGQLLIDRTPRQRGKGEDFLRLGVDDLRSRLARAEWLQAVAIHFCVELGAVSVSMTTHGGQELPIEVPAPPVSPPPRWYQDHDDG
ncbi:hypothetical protein [Nocardioides aequoreus]|uniref:hypothetical protein n=1 Tax=Nocardioides aequoreus TaxID=397278 RepID=UPI0004C3C496|nr:hypothetical protein [Nocardioides aequoreus]